MWRPKKNWDAIVRDQCYDGDVVYRELDTFEAGADAILKALRSDGFHITVGQVLEIEGEKIKATKNQTLVLIPDEG